MAENRRNFGGLIDSKNIIKSQYLAALEIGTVMFGLGPDGREKPAGMELVRLTFPRRVYTQSHVDYLEETILAAHAQREGLPGYRIEWQAPILRHFTARLQPINGGIRNRV